MRGLTDAERESFIKAGRTRHIPKDTYLFHQNDLADTLYIVLTGKIRLAQLTSEGDQVIVHHSGPGGCVGIIVALSDAIYPVSGKTLEDSDLLCWDAPTVKQFMLRCPHLALNGIEMISQHFVRAQDRYR
ncbi:MAG: cyclic nucleotide-binding domain-containing protein, partial [Chloroflexi bacterium]|nr:cyclic nucleotide-binding domain-containing protein [Chloroflexota bacterium]